MKPLIIFIALSASLATSAFAQKDVIAQRAIVTGLGMHVTNADGAVMSASQVLSIARGSVRQTIAENISSVADGIIRTHIEGSSDALRTAGTLRFSGSVNPSGRITEQHSVNVRVNFDARPIGGILNVRVELIPTFGGVGAASRPALSREFAEAVDSFDDELVGATIARLTHELAAEFATK